MKQKSSVYGSRNFKLLWFSQIMSQLTLYILNFLLILKIFEVTGSTVATSFLWIAYALPALIFGPIASAIVDTTDRRKLLILSNGIQTVVVVVSIFFVANKIMASYIFVFIYSMVNQLYVPSEFAVLPSTVSKYNYARANSLFLITQQLSIIVGFTIAGSLEEVFGFGTTLLVCAGLLMSATISVYFLPKLKMGKSTPKGIKAATKLYFSKVVEGYKFITSKKYILYPLLVLIGMSTTVSIITVNMPAIAKDLVRVPAESSGLVIALPVGIGALIGAYFASKSLSGRIRKITFIKFSVCLFLLGLFMITIPSYFPLNILALYISIFGTLVIGFSFLGMVVPVLTYLQEVLPKDMRGRVFGNFWFMVTIISIFPVVLSGFISEHLGSDVLFIVLILFTAIGLVLTFQKGDNFIKSNFRK